MTAREAADELDCAPVTVNLHARRLGLGVLLTPRMRIFSAADVRRLRKSIADRPGPRPKSPRSRG